jgi:hypothetical protein
VCVKEDVMTQQYTRIQGGTEYRNKEDEPVKGEGWYAWLNVGDLKTETPQPWSRGPFPSKEAANQKLHETVDSLKAGKTTISLLKEDAS